MLVRPRTPVGHLLGEPLTSWRRPDRRSARVAFTLEAAPGRARDPGLVDEVPDERVGLLVEALGDEDRVAEVLEGAAVGVQHLDVGDEVVEGNREVRGLRRARGAPASGGSS